MRHLASFALALFPATLVVAAASGCSSAHPETNAAGASADTGVGQNLTGIGGKCLDVYGSNSRDGATVGIWTCHGGQNQNWTYTADKTLVGLDDKCLDVAGAGTADGNRVQLYTCNGTVAQVWEWNGAELVNPHSGKCLDVTGNVDTDGTLVEIWDCWGGPNQKWTFPTTTTSPPDSGAPPPPPPIDAGSPADAGSATDASPGGGSTTGTEAKSAASFLDTLGVCTHIGQGVDDPTKSATALAYAGFHNLRDDGVPSHVPDWISVYKTSGVKTDILTNDDLASTMSMADQLAAAGALLSVEGANEPNNFHVTYDGQTATPSTTFAPVAALQRDIYAAVKADSALAGIHVFHSSEAGGSEPDNQGLQFLQIPSGAGTAMPDGTQYADYANTHNYVCGHSGVISDNVAWNAEDPTLDGDWDGMYVEYGHTWNKGFAGYATSELPSVPRVTTETGWTTSGSGSLTLDQQGKVLTNLFLSAFARGWSYTFVYMLRDDPNQGYWGFFDTSYNAKPSGTFLHNLTTILADSGAGATQKLPYSIANEPATVHDLLLQKANGKFELVVWDERYSGGTDAVTVKLGSTVSTVSVYDPTVGSGATQTLTDVSSVDLSLSDHPLVLEL